MQITKNRAAFPHKKRYRGTHTHTPRRSHRLLKTCRQKRTSCPPNCYSVFTSTVLKHPRVKDRARERERDAAFALKKYAAVFVRFVFIALFPITREEGMKKTKETTIV